MYLRSPIFISKLLEIFPITFFQHQVEKAQDFVEECKNIGEVKGEDLRELANNLNIQMKVFRERLEETRVQLENSSRCFLLLESCHDILEDDNKEQEEFVKLALRSGNTKLQELCKVKVY